MLERYVVVDLEMTGLNPKTDKIIEIGAARVEKGKVTAEYETFVNPEIRIPEKVTEITGITEDMVRKAPKIKDVIEGLVTFCGEDILVGHNVIFDYSFIKQAAINEKMPFEKEAVDTLKIARKMLPELEHKTLEFLCSYYEIERPNGHRALCDVLATGELLEKLKEEFMKENPDVFRPLPLIYKAKRQTAATKIQKSHLKELVDYHKISIDIDFEILTRSEASRITDKIISQYGRMPKEAL